MSLSYTSPHRTILPLKGYNAFDAVFRHGARFAYRGVTAFILFENVIQQEQVAQDPAMARICAVHQDTPNAVIVGVSVKRRTRPAVLRNRIKRILRASLQIIFTKEQQASRGIVAMILICNIIPEKPSLLVLDDVLPLVRRIVQNADKYYSSRHLQNSSQNTSHKSSQSSSHNSSQTELA
jgi:ribonuclease P protein component